MPPLPQAWVEELFGAVPGGGGPRPCLAAAGPPFGAPQPPMLCMVAGVKEAHELHITFPLPPMEAQYLAKPDEYVSHLIGHEGGGSLLSCLKAAGWASGLCAGVSDGGHERASYGWLFSVGVTLTDVGLAAWQSACGLVFAYIRMAAAPGPQRWIFDELAAIKEMEFRFSEEEEAADYCVRIASKAHAFAPAHAVAGDSLLSLFDADAIADCLARLTPHNAR